MYEICRQIVYGDDEQKGEDYGLGDFELHSAHLVRMFSHLLRRGASRRASVFHRISGNHVSQRRRCDREQYSQESTPLVKHRLSDHRRRAQ